MHCFITGSGGFIGYHLTAKYLKEGRPVVGLDNFNNYYDVKLKQERYKKLSEISQNYRTEFIQIKGDLEDKNKIEEIFRKYKPNIVIHLAAQAGVRYSIENPSAYISSNIVGFSNILDGCINHNVKHLVYASSSSVYGGNTDFPFSEKKGVDHPISMYAATKKSNELMAHVYSHLYGLPTTGLRFFTVYGPWGRPDMALFKFTKNILNRKPIEVFNNGNLVRDFTYIDDIVESMTRVVEKYPTANQKFDTSYPDPSTSWAPFRIFNIGNSNPTSLMDYISAIEDALDIKAIISYLPMQDGDLQKTAADTTLLKSWINFKPKTSINVGINSFVSWYKSFYKI